MKRQLILPIFLLIALVTGFANALLAFQINSLFFCLLPLWAFAFGYFSSSKMGALIGLLSAFLLFMGYTTTISFLLISTSSLDNMPIDYIYNFIVGGWCLCLIGYGVPLVKRSLVTKGIKSPEAAALLIILVLLVSWCTFLSLPKYTYYYQVIFESSEGLTNLELCLPVAAISDQPYTEIFNHPLWDSRVELTEDYSLELADTEHGIMLKLRIADLSVGVNESERQVSLLPGIDNMTKPAFEKYPYTENVIFKMSGISFTSYQELELLPKYDTQAINLSSDERFIWFSGVSARETVEKFTVPLKATADRDADIRISLECTSSREANINFVNWKTECYSERLRFETLISNEWVLAGGQAERYIIGGGGGD